MQESLSSSHRPEVPVALIGMMGCGKSRIGRELATVLGRSFYDSDDEIEEAAGTTCRDIFELYGEQAFRDCEAKVLTRLLSGTDTVIATGGGAPLNAGVKDSLFRNSFTVWLNPPLDLVVARLEDQSAKRPVLQVNKDLSLRDRVQMLMEERRSAYEQADCVVQNFDGTSHDLALRIARAFNEKRISL